MQSRSEGRKRANDFSVSSFGFDERRGHAPFSITESNKQEEVRSNRAFVFGDCGLVNIAKESAAGL